jgi:hypothetical protein
LDVKNVIYPPKGKKLPDILYLNSTPGPCDIDSVLDDEMEELECRLASRKQYLVSKQEQEQQLPVVPNEENPKPAMSRKLSSPRAKLIRSETGSSLVSTMSIRTATSSMYDTADTMSEACTFSDIQSAETGSMSLNDFSDGIIGISSCDSFLNAEKEFKKQTTVIGPVDVDDFIPKDSMYFEEDYGDWFILDEVEISRGLAGYEIGFEPETIWSVNLDEINSSFRKKKSRSANTTKPSIPTNSKPRPVPTRKPRLARARSSVT